MWDGLLYTLDEVGEKIGISEERVRQIQKDGLLRIHHFREAQRHLAEEPKRRRPQPELQSASRRTAVPDPPLSDVSDGPFPGWELYVASFVHPIKVAIMEILCWMDAPLSVVQFTKLCSSGGESFREAKVRYHLYQLVKVGVLEIVTSSPLDEEGEVDTFFYFADRAGSSALGCPPARVPQGTQVN